MDPILIPTYDVLAQIREMLEHPSIKMVADSGIIPAVVDMRHVRLEMPFQDANKNHMGTLYAMSIGVLMEIAGGALLQATYGFSKYAIVLKKMEIRYLKPCREALICDLSLTEEQAEEMIAPVEERGRGNIFVPIKLTSPSGEEIAVGDFNYYLLPAGVKL